MGRPRTISIGQKFNRLTVLSFHHSDNVGHWLCRCDCGGEAVVATAPLKSGETKSCGCLRRSQLKTHGKSKTSEYGIWQGMLSRCYRQSDKAFKHYGGRGITVCKRWRESFLDFLADMGPRPSPELEVDRFPDNDGNYEPANCRWATRKQQCNNRRNNRIIEWQGRSMSLAQWADERGLLQITLADRLNRGWSLSRIMATPRINRDRIISFRGKTKQMTEWAREFGVNPNTLWARLNRGMSIASALTTPVQKHG